MRCSETALQTWSDFSTAPDKTYNLRGNCPGMPPILFSFIHLIKAPMVYEWNEQSVGFAVSLVSQSVRIDINSSRCVSFFGILLEFLFTFLLFAANCFVIYFIAFCGFFICLLIPYLLMLRFVCWKQIHFTWK